MFVPIATHLLGRSQLQNVAACRRLHTLDSARDQQAEIHRRRRQLEPACFDAGEVQQQCQEPAEVVSLADDRAQALVDRADVSLLVVDQSSK